MGKSRARSSVAEQEGGKAEQSSVAEQCSPFSSIVEASTTSKTSNLSSIKARTRFQILHRSLKMI
ncbi:hypothetical protein BVRB_1g010500 [Beta vulgaris subsp. vulgaris]|nr:hypothetical protein BVRB_1g010500 [Beta vulgaris subsp. vulgaris]